MAGSGTAVHAGLQFRARPAFWLRRLLHFPFYFESTNPSFRIDIKRVSDPPPREDVEGGVIRFQVAFADGTVTSRDAPVPELKVGESQTLTLPDIYTAFPGQTIVRIVSKRAVAGFRSEEWKTLYSYQVRPEEQIWLWVFYPLLGLALGAGTTTLGVFIQKWFG